jgi:hypothetical protein
MLNIRVVTAGAILFAMAGTAVAQSDTGQAPSQDPGKPMSLFQALFKSGSAETPSAPEAAATTAEAVGTPETAAHTKTAHRHWHRHRYASKKTHPAQDGEAAAATPAAPGDAAQANAMPADTAAPPAATFDASATASLPGAAATAADPSEPSAMVVDGHTVQITSQDQINALDLAADAATSTPPQPATKQANPNFDAMAAADNMTAADNMPTADNAPAADSTPANTPIIAFAERNEGDNNNRDIWYEDLLAILGGVLAAASAAWFMIGHAPPRRDGREPMLAYEVERMRR